MNEGETTNLASRYKRLGGVLIDGLIAGAIIVPIMLVTGVMQQTISGQQMTIIQKVIFFVIGWVVFIILNGYLLFKRGQTIGKVVVKTRIVDMSGNVPSFKKIIVLRYLIFGLAGQIPILGSIVGLVNAIFIFGEERRCIHDYMAGTRVINTL